MVLTYIQTKELEKDKINNNANPLFNTYLSYIRWLLAVKYCGPTFALKEFTSLLIGVKGLFFGFLVEVRVIVGLAGVLVKIFYSSMSSFFSSSSLLDLSEISFSSGGRMLPVTISSSSSSISMSFEKSRHLSANVAGSAFFGIKVYAPT